MNVNRVIRFQQDGYEEEWREKLGLAEFEEKEFEKPLYNQLENGKCDVWAPGQCLEGYIGFDFSGDINLYEFWERFGGFIPRGAILKDYNMGYIWRKMKRKRMLPDFSINLFIQAKRPYIHSGRFSDSKSEKQCRF